MRRLTALLLCLGLSLPQAARAACEGEDLIAAMPVEARAELRQAAAEHPFAEGILWRAEKDGRRLHLVGTMHLYDARHAATLDRVRPLLAEAETVFLEMGAGDEELLQRMIAEDPSLAFLTEGPTLPDLLGPGDWDRLKAAMTERGIPGFMAAKMKPWMAMANLAMSRCDLENLQKGLRGLDAMVIEAAQARGLPVLALEPLDTALRIFASFSQEEQLDLLRLGLSQQAGDSADQAVTVAEAYFREEVQLIWEFAMAMSKEMEGITPEMLDAQAARLEEVLVTQRNRSWMAPILEAEGDAVIAVGAMHLPGEEGLLRLLEDEGFTVTRLPVSD